MSNMKCPFCGKEMICGGTICRYNPDCPIYDKPVPTEVLELLDRTRKALGAAKKWLMKIGYLNMSDHGLGSEKMMTDWCKTVALHGLKEIETALEQKDVK